MPSFERGVWRSSDFGPGDCRGLLADIVIPRPIAWISTANPRGGANLAPFSSFAAVCDQPPLIAVSIASRAARPKDTLANIRATGVFCVNCVTIPQVEVMRATAKDYPSDVDEFVAAGVAQERGRCIDVPFVAAAPVVLECRLFREHPLPANHSLVIGEVVAFHLPMTWSGSLHGWAVAGHVGKDSYVSADHAYGTILARARKAPAVSADQPPRT